MTCGRRTRLWFLGLLLAACVPAFPHIVKAETLLLTLDPAQTRIDYTLGATLHVVHGTFRVKSSEIRFDPATGEVRGSVVVDATSGRSGNDSRDERMNREILLSRKFPDIVFTPRHAKSGLRDFIGTKDATEVHVDGQFRLLGKDHDIVLVIVIQPNDQKWQVSSHFSIPYIDWGLKNPNTFLLRVSPTVDINVHAAGQLTSVNR